MAEAKVQEVPSAQRHPRVRTGVALPGNPFTTPEDQSTEMWSWKSFLPNAHPSPSSRGLHRAVGSRALAVLGICNGPGPTVPLLRPSLAHLSLVLSPWRRKPKLSKIQVMCSESDCDSVISWESRHAVLATIPVCSKLMWMDLFNAYLFQSFFFMTFPQFLDLQFSLLWNLITEPGKIAEQGMFPPCNFTLNQPPSAWGLHGERIDFEFAKWYDHEIIFWFYLNPTKNISYTWNANSFLFLLFSSWNSEITREWGNTTSGSSVMQATLSFAFCFFLSTDIPWSEQGRQDTEILTMSKCSMLAWSNSSIFHIYVTLWK